MKNIIKFIYLKIQSLIRGNSKSIEQLSDKNTRTKVLCYAESLSSIGQIVDSYVDYCLLNDKLLVRLDINDFAMFIKTDAALNIINLFHLQETDKIYIINHKNELENVYHLIKHYYASKLNTEPFLNEEFLNKCY